MSRDLMLVKQTKMENTPMMIKTCHFPVVKESEVKWYLYSFQAACQKVTDLETAP